MKPSEACGFFRLHHLWCAHERGKHMEYYVCTAHIQHAWCCVHFFRFLWKCHFFLPFFNSYSKCILTCLQKRIFRLLPSCPRLLRLFFLFFFLAPLHFPSHFLRAQIKTYSNGCSLWVIYMQRMLFGKYSDDNNNNNSCDTKNTPENIIISYVCVCAHKYADAGIRPYLCVIVQVYVFAWQVFRSIVVGLDGVDGRRWYIQRRHGKGSLQTITIHVSPKMTHIPLQNVSVRTKRRTKNCLLPS